MESSADISSSLHGARDAISMGDLDRAIGLLTGVIPAAPDRWEPKELLGTAYLRKGMVQAGLEALHAAAVQSPPGSGARYSYAAALQSTGFSADAVREYQEILRVNPADPHAAQALAALGALPQAAPAAATAPPLPFQNSAAQPLSPQYPAPPPVAPQYPMASSSALPQPAVPPIAPQSPAAHSLAPQYPGAPQPAPLYPAAPPLAQPYSPAASPGPAGGYGSQGLAGGTGAPPRPVSSTPPPSSVYSGTPRQAPMDDEGGWSFSNLFRVITGPRSFMAEQQGQQGLAEPAKYCAGLIVLGSILALVLGLANAFASGAGGAIAGANPGGLAMGLVIGLLISAVSLAIAAAIGVVVVMAIAGAFHLLVLLFRGRGGYGATFRAFVYACTPSAIVGPFLMMVPRMLPGVPLMPLWWIVSIWALVLLALGLREIHEMALPGAIAVALLPGASLYLCLFLLAQLVMGWGRGGIVPLPGGRPTFGQSAGAFGPPPGDFRWPPGYGPHGEPPVFVPPAGSSGHNTTTVRTVGPDGKVHVTTKTTYFGGARPPH